jgi:YVTN family beta-propeller protein
VPHNDPTTHSRWLVAGAFVLALLIATVTSGDSAPDRPGPIGGGVTLLPNGWKIAPAGRHLQVGHLPLAMLESPDGRSLLVATNGFAKPAVTVVDLDQESVRESVVVDYAWLGLAWHPDGQRVYVSGGGNNSVHEMYFVSGKLTRGPDVSLGPSLSAPPPGTNDLTPTSDSQGFIGGVAISPDGARLFAVQVVGQLLTAVDLKTRTVVHSVMLTAEPYTCIVSPDGATVFVSLWGGAKVLLFDAHTLEPRGEIAVGAHPNAMAMSRDGRRLFVACANTNAVWAIDVNAQRAVEQISVALFPDAPPGATPNHVSLSPDGRRLLVANADNNAVAVVDVSQPAASHVDGFIPTGWYPTAAMFSHDGSRIFILSGKGLSSQANPRFATRGDPQYVGGLLTGSLSIVPSPDRAWLEAFTKQVYAATPYTDEHRLTPVGSPSGSPIPQRVGDASPITHVFYIIRENRSYDQVFGDLERGNSDPTLCLFGEETTPNAHALAREFGILDNFYVNAEISYDGHAFSTGAYATDIVEKFGPTNDAGRGAPDLSDGGGKQRTDYGNIAAPPGGYLWDGAIRKGLTVRSYGEFVLWGRGRPQDRVDGRVELRASVPSLEGRVSLEYPPFELKIPDERRADVWLKDFHALEADGQIPALSIIRLGNDHTVGTTPGAPTPRAMVADNDLALGRIVEAISHSEVWKTSAIFILEDDAQNGPDHVDAHRSIALVVSPFSHRHAVDSTLYTTSGMLRSMELILGLAPMSQYDASATPMYKAFQSSPVPAPFTHLDARIPLDEKNDPHAWGSHASLQMDLADADRAPEQELNEILWRSVKGASAPMPQVVHTAWLQTPKGAALNDGDDR